MANELAVINRIDSKNFLDYIMRDIAPKIITSEDKDRLQKSVMTVFFELRNVIDRWENIPSVNDVLDEIEYINMGILDEIAGIVLEYDEDRKKEFESLKNNKSSVYNSDLDILEDLIESIMSEWYFVFVDTSSKYPITYEMVFDILHNSGETFSLGHEDRLFQYYPHIGDTICKYTAAVLVNSAQGIILPEFSWGLYRYAYYSAEHAHLYKERNYELVRGEPKNRIIDAATQLEHVRKW